LAISDLNEGEMFVKAGRLVAVLVLICACLGVGASVAAAAPGDVDRFFGQEGVTRLDAPTSAFVSPVDMAVAPGNAVYVLQRQVQCTTTPCVVEFFVTRLNPAGTLDESFGRRSVFGSIDQADAGGQGSLAIAPDGKIVVASTIEGELLLGRLNPDGSPDGSFGKAGVARAGLGGPVVLTRVVVQKDGAIVVAAQREADGSGSTTVVVARYTTTGVPDPSFNGGVPVLTGLGSGLGGFGVFEDGGSAFAGPACCGTPTQPVQVGRLAASGAFDEAFADRGRRFIDDVTPELGVGAVIALPGGRIVVVGHSRRSNDAFVLRLLPNGRLDRTFGRRGIVFVPDSFRAVVGAALDTRGRLILVGTGSPTGRGNSLVVARRGPKGGPDRTFGGGSIVPLESPSGTRAVAMDLQSGGRIVALAEAGACFRSCPSPKSLLVRYIGGASNTRCLGKRATIVGTRQPETLIGTPRRDVIAALSGADTVRGRGGSDLICGGQGNDTLSGGKGRDRIQGGPGRDRLRQ
jgi:uncharacterized delta-60 repeat protein